VHAHVVVVARRFAHRVEERVRVRGSSLGDEPRLFLRLEGDVPMEEEDERGERDGGRGGDVPRRAGVREFSREEFGDEGGVEEGGERGERGAPRPLRDGHGRDEVEVEVRVELGGVGRRLGRGRAVQGVRGGAKGREGPARAEADEGPRVG